MGKSQNVPPDSSYQRLSSCYSLNSLARFFNIGDENAQEPTEKSCQIAHASIIALAVVWACLYAYSLYMDIPMLNWPSRGL